MGSEQEKKVIGRPKSDDPKNSSIRIRTTEKERDFYARCVAHASMGRNDGNEDNRSAFIRHLFTQYAAEHGIPFDTSAPLPLTADQMFAKLGVTDNGPARYVVYDSTALDDDIDPDRFDESYTSTIDPLPARHEV